MGEPGGHWFLVTGDQVPRPPRLGATQASSNQPPSLRPLPASAERLLSSLTPSPSALSAQPVALWVADTPESSML